MSAATGDAMRWCWRIGKQLAVLALWVIAWWLGGLLAAAALGLR
jgi:hypothetical protein